MRHDFRVLDQKRRELAEVPTDGGPPAPVTPIELPVPESTPMPMIPKAPRSVARPTTVEP